MPCCLLFAGHPTEGANYKEPKGCNWCIVYAGTLQIKWNFIFGQPVMLQIGGGGVRQKRKGVLQNLFAFEIKTQLLCFVYAL